MPRMQLNEHFAIKKTEKCSNQAVEGKLLYSNHNDDTCGVRDNDDKEISKSEFINYVV